MQSLTITTKIMSWIPAYGQVHNLMW